MSRAVVCDRCGAMGHPRLFEASDTSGTTRHLAGGSVDVGGCDREYTHVRATMEWPSIYAHTCQSCHEVIVRVATERMICFLQEKLAAISAREQS